MSSPGQYYRWRIASIVNGSALWQREGTGVDSRYHSFFDNVRLHAELRPRSPWCAASRTANDGRSSGRSGQYTGSVLSTSNTAAMSGFFQFKLSQVCACLLIDCRCLICEASHEASVTSVTYSQSSGIAASRPLFVKLSPEGWA